MNIGLVGCGFAATLHAEAYQKMYGYDIQLKGVADPSEKREAFARKYGITYCYDTLEEMLKNNEIDVIDICTPPCFHVDMVKQSMLAGKHVICEKPITGYFDGDGEIGNTVDRQMMFNKVMEELEDLKQFLQSTDRIFMYAENFIYAPSIRKSKEFLEKTKNKILFLKGEESHSGSHAPHAALWRYTGGGSFMRQGCHPLSAILYLKNIEAQARGEQITVTSVIGDVGNTLRSVGKEERRFIAAHPVDVEDCANVILTFSDGTKANIVSGDMVVGGVKNLVEVYTTSGVYLCHIAPNDQMKVYHVTEENLRDTYITEKVETKCGWQEVCIDEEFVRGYVGELQDFMQCIDKHTQPESNFQLAYDTAKVIYAAYLSAELGKRINL